MRAQLGRRITRIARARIHSCSFTEKMLFSRLHVGLTRSPCHPVSVSGAPPLFSAVDAFRVFLLGPTRDWARLMCPTRD